MLFSITNTWSDEVPEKHCLQWHLCRFLNPIIFLLKMCYYIPIFTETTTRLSTTETSATSGNLKETSFLKWTSDVNHLHSVDVVDIVAVEKESMVRIIIEDIKEFSTLLSVESNPRLLWFRFTSLFDWLREFTPPSQPIRIITKSNRNLVTNLKVNWHFFSLFFLFFRFFSSDNWDNLDDKFWSNFSNNSLNPFRYSLLITLFTTPGFIFHEKTTRGFRFQLSLRTLIRGFFQSLIFFSYVNKSV